MDRAKVAVPQDVMEGLEAMRLTGQANLLDVPEVIRLAVEMEHYTAALWVEEHKSLYVQGILHGFCAERGDETCVG